MPTDEWLKNIILSEVLGSLLDFYDIFTEDNPVRLIENKLREIELVESVNTTTSGSPP